MARIKLEHFEDPYGPPASKPCPCVIPLPLTDHSCDELCPKRDPPPTPTPPSSSSHKHYALPVILTVAIVVLATAFLCFTLYTVYRFYTCWRRSNRRRNPSPDDGVEEFLDEDRGPIMDHPIWYIRTVGLDASVIEAITVIRYKRGEGLIDGSDCSVCLSEFQDDETLRLLPKCNHAFHLPCIDTWLRSHTNCPMCRASIVSPAAAVDNNTPLAAPTPADHNPEEIRIAVSELEPDLQTNQSLGQCNGSPVRRSISLDSISALTIHNAVQRQQQQQQLDRDSGKQLMEEKGEIEAAKDRSNGGRVNELSSQTGPSSAVKRSLSCTAKVFLSRHSSRSQNSL